MCQNIADEKNYKEAEQYLEQMCNVGADVWNDIDTNHMIVERRKADHIEMGERLIGS